MTNAGPAHFKHCTGLTKRVANETRMTAAGPAAFHATVPGCQIAHDGGVIEPKK